METPFSILCQLTHASPLGGVDAALQPPSADLGPCEALAGPGAAEGGPILDKNDGNVPSRRRLGRKHYMHRARIRTAMRWWEREGLDLWWVTLTSSASFEVSKLRRHFQAWRKRLERSLEVPESSVQYVMVDTREGHGVLHLILAIPAGARMGRHQLDYGEIGSWWQEIHGARQVKFLAVRQGDSSIRRLSQYIVSQYMANGQGDALVRISGSRIRAPLAQWRRALFSQVTKKTRAYQAINALGPLGDMFEVVWRYFRGEQWRTARIAWDSLLTHGWCEFYGEKWCIEADGSLGRV